MGRPRDSASLQERGWVGRGWVSWPPLLSIDRGRVWVGADGGLSHEAVLLQAGDCGHGGLAGSDDRVPEGGPKSDESSDES